MIVLICFQRRKKNYDPECTALARKRTENSLLIENRLKWKITTELLQGVVLFH